MHAPHLLGASYIVLRKDDLVLLQRRYQTGYMDGFYSLPAGHTEKNEPFSKTLVREIQEEIGITPSPEETSIAYISHRYSSEDYQIVDVFYTCTSWESDPTICEPEKADDLSWHPLSALPENTIPYVREALENIAKGQLYGEWGWDTTE